MDFGPPYEKAIQHRRLPRQSIATQHLSPSSAQLVRSHATFTPICRGNEAESSQDKQRICIKLYIYSER